MVRILKVGGCVRDQLLGVPFHDIDFAVEADSFEEMEAHVRSITKNVFLIKPEFFTIRAQLHSGEAVDFVLCRKDGIHSDGRRPDSVEKGTIFDDLARRDFTVNALAIDEAGILLDPHGGESDLAQKLLRCVGDTEERFNEDSLRILRAIRFHITKGFSLHKDIQKVFSQPKIWIPKLKNVSEERTREELFKCFNHSTVETLRFFKRIPFEWTEALFQNLWLLPTNRK